jgi:hypothetical protein
MPTNSGMHARIIQRHLNHDNLVTLPYKEIMSKAFMANDHQELLNIILADLRFVEVTLKDSVSRLF